MADDIIIQLGSETIKVPKWATEETASKMAVYNQMSAKALTNMIAKTKSGEKLAKENTKIFKEMKKAAKDRADADLADQNESKKKTKKSTDNLKSASDKLTGASKKVNEAFSSNNLSGIIAAIAGTTALGTALGFGVGILEAFAKNVSELSNVGLGLGVSLEDLRNQAALTGLDMEGYSKLVMANGDALRAMGSSAQDGARQFSDLSRQTRLAAREFNNFGLTNAEFNEILLEEVDLRRKSGMAQAEITQSLSSSMNGLLKETTALSAMTGQDRREMLRNRNELLSTSAVTAYRMALEQEGGKLADNFGSLATVFGAGGEVGKQLGNAIATGIATDVDFMTANQGAFAAIGSISMTAQEEFQKIDEFVRNNFKTMETGEFNARLTSMLGGMADAIPADELRDLGLYASQGVESADSLISLISELQGLDTSIQNNIAAHDAATEGLKSTDILALASTVEELTNRIKASALTSALNFVSKGVNLEGAALIDALQAVADNFGPGIGLFEGMAETVDELTSATDKAVLALAGLAAVAGKLAIPLALMMGTTPAAIAAAAAAAASGAAAAAGTAIVSGTAAAATVAGVAAPLTLTAGTIAALVSSVKTQDEAVKALTELFPAVAGTFNGKGVPPQQAKYHLDMEVRAPGWIDTLIADHKSMGTYSASPSVTSATPATPVFPGTGGGSFSPSDDVSKWLNNNNQAAPQPLFPQFDSGNNVIRPPTNAPTSTPPVNSVGGIPPIGSGGVNDELVSKQLLEYLARVANASERQAEETRRLRTSTEESQ